jgi:hypothetical protein
MPEYPVNPLHPSLNLTIAIADGLTSAAQELIKASRKKYHVAHRRRVGSTLRPGAETPTWNALVLEMRPYLRKRGEKINLARWLGVYPSRVHEYFQQRRSMPDAERTLLLLQYLALRRAGRCPG